MVTPELNGQISLMRSRIEFLEGIVNELGLSLQSVQKNAFPTKTQATSIQGMTKAICIETVDPWQENRVRFYHPILHSPDTPILALPFAKPISAMGGFDGCGLTWVPPAGSTLCLLFQNGNREDAYYLGTTWHRDRGPDGNLLTFPSREYDSIYRGHRKGYLVGPNDESQVLPPWNTENYNANDSDSVVDFETDPDQQKRATYPNIYGFKTPENHMWKAVDGDAKCNRRQKRIEMLSGGGNWFIMKDDHMHDATQIAHPSCGATDRVEDISLCTQNKGKLPYFTDFQGTPIEKELDCGQQVLGGHPSTPGKTSKYYQNQAGANKYFKHANECRPYKGPGTPQNNRCALPQTGIQILSIGGNTIVLDDSVEEPRGIPNRERCLEDFDFGCNNKCLGSILISSMTGHSIRLNDVEEETGLRGEENFVEMRSATGNFIQLNDHTIGVGNQSDCVPCPPNHAGEKRGVHIGSTSRHSIKLIDHMNPQCSPCRAEGGVPVARATEAYIQIKSGYGLETRYSDDNSQTETQNQWIQITNPQCISPDTDGNCNIERGPHFMRFQARPQGEPGVIFLRAGGHSVRSTYDMDIVMVGDKENNPADKFTYVSKKRISQTEDVDYRFSGKQHVFFAEEQILLMAGRDCPPAPKKKCKGPCLYSVIVSKCPVYCPLTGILHWTEQSMSERVLASAFHPCGGNCDSNNCNDAAKSAYNQAMANAENQPCSDNKDTTTVNTGSGEITIDTAPVDGVPVNTNG